MDSTKPKHKYEKMNPEQSIKLIEAVQKIPWLWKKGNKDYKNINRQEQAWTIIADELLITVDDTKRQWKVLLANFRVYKAKVKKSQVTGSGRDEIYKPRWFAYESMLFISESSDVVKIVGGG
ncbi:uncharacterized protein LOC126579871 [Anopheles aquasalis]|uniref:uncharacterized protein LOC126579871 n=1 Tax=Anopheles aquasalis TaxID=42839 RepID=UPI00215A14D8|nr:uncharacterized protein LOC126579871 [Anopheles aquasalis]